MARNNLIPCKVFLLIIIMILNASLASCSDIKEDREYKSIPSEKQNNEVTPVTNSQPTITPEQEITATTDAINNLGEDLSINGPWFIYRNIYSILIAANQDGTGRTELTNENTTLDLMKISGPFLSYLSSSTSNGLLADRTLLGDANVLLSVYQLPQIEPILVLPLLNDAIEIPAQEDLLYPTSELISIVIEELKWSPDSQELAFAAALDGPSSDLYLYNVSDKSITRLTDGPDQAGKIHWSPDGKWIIYESIFSYKFMRPGFRSSTAVWSAASDGSKVIKLFDIPYGADNGGPISSEFLGCVSNNQCFISLFGHLDYSQNQVLLVNPETAKIQVLPISDYLDIDLNPRTEVLLFSVNQFNSSSPEAEVGTHIAPVSGGPPIKITDISGDIGWIPNTNNFFISAYTDFYIFTDNGRIIAKLEGITDLPYLSPDGKMIAFRTEETVSIFTAGGDQIQEIPITSHVVKYPYDLYWMPNSKGFFFRGVEADGDTFGFNLFSVEIGNDPTLIASDFPTSSFPSFYTDAVWVTQ
jgi:hypothetical protein